MIQQSLSASADLLGSTANLAQIRHKLIRKTATNRPSKPSQEHNSLEIDRKIRVTMPGCFARHLLDVLVFILCVVLHFLWDYPIYRETGLAAGISFRVTEEDGGSGGI